MKKLLSTFAALASFGTAISPAAASQVEAFYKGKTISIFVWYAPGGGADICGRFIARHLGKHVPGSPEVIVQNMPGAGGLAAVNYVYNNAPKDGTVMILPSTSAFAAPMLGTQNVRFDTFKFQWLGNFTRDISSCVVSGNSGIKNITEAANRQIIFGFDGFDDPATHHPRMLANLLGYKTKAIAGYQGTGPALLAMEAGEIDARCSVWASYILSSKQDEVKAGKLVPIVQVGTRKSPVFGDAPLVLDLAQNDEQRQIMRFIVAPVEISRPLALPPGVPAERVAALREALWTAAHSPAMRAEAEKSKFLIEPMNAEDTEAALRDSLNVSPETAAKAKAAMETVAER